MARKITKEIQYVRLSERRIREIEDLVASWPYETRSFMRARLNQYKPPSDLVNSMLDRVLSLFMAAPQKHFIVLKDPDILTDWQKRFEISGQSNPQEAWRALGQGLSFPSIVAGPGTCGCAHSLGTSGSL